MTITDYVYTYEELEELLRLHARDESSSRITQGEILTVINTTYGKANITRAAKAANIARSTAYERRKVVEFYGTLSAGQTIYPGYSTARELLERYPSLQYTHLRTAISLGSRYDALKAVIQAASQVMTPEEFKRHVAIERKKKGYKPTRIEIQARAGYRVIIVRD